MVKQVTLFDLLISCPSDVKEELYIIKETVDIFNRMYGSANNAWIAGKHWSTDSYPESGGNPQKLLNKQLILNCDAAVAVFWTRFGTPTDEYGSGTEEEIEELLKSGKQVFLYFSDCQVNLSSIDHDQYQKVLAFRDKYKDKGIYGTYSSTDDFRKDFLNHLSLYFVRLLNDGDTIVKTTNSKLSIGDVNSKISSFERILTRILPEISDVTGVHIKDIGLHVWLVQTPEPPNDPILIRVVRVRFSDTTPSRPRTWRRGEGVVGRCWEMQTDVAVNLADPTYLGTSEELWEKYPEDVTMCQSLQDFQDTTRFFKAICASPIVPYQEAVGCISLNFDRESVPDFDRLWCREVKNLLRRAAGDVALILRQFEITG